MKNLKHQRCLQQIYNKKESDTLNAKQQKNGDEKKKF